MATTTPEAILLALRAAVTAVGAWRLIEQPEELVSGEVVNDTAVPVGVPLVAGDRSRASRSSSSAHGRFHDTLLLTPRSRTRRCSSARARSRT
jgi:hypothetical protein